MNSFVVDALTVHVFTNDADLAAAAAREAADGLREALAARGTANVMFASGNSQLLFLADLVLESGIDWSLVTAFHMDEYAGVPPSHPASFQRYMRERVASLVPVREFHYLSGDTGDPAGEAERYATLLRDHPLDVCCLGIGENGHLAFNDPGVADFDDPFDVKVVTLDDTCRRQQVGEGHFPDVASVPARAITVTIPALLRAARVVAIVPEARKAVPVRDVLEGPVAESCPASILRRHAHARLYLDTDSAALWTRRP